MSKGKIIGERIKEFRKCSGFSQANIAAYLNVDQSLISKAETGERNLSVDMLEKLAFLFGVDYTAFENEAETASPLSFALRAQELTAADMEAIGAINRIALNSEFMARLLAGDSIDQ